MKRLFEDWIAPLAMIAIIVYFIWCVTHFA